MIKKWLIKIYRDLFTDICGECGYTLKMHGYDDERWCVNKKCKRSVLYEAKTK